MRVETGLILMGSYLVGAIPFGYVIAKVFYQTDIRTVGSKNPGATNVWRTFGKGPGFVTLTLDMVKGVLPVLVAQRLTGNELWPLLAGMIAIIGHNWSVFLLGKGGKGVATSAGAFLALLPEAMTVALIVFLAVFLTTKTVSLGSMVAAVSLFIATFFFPTSGLYQIFVFIAGALILIKHVPNMKRLRQGTEPKARFK